MNPLGCQLPRGSIVVPFWGSYLESYKVTPKRNYYGACGYASNHIRDPTGSECKAQKLSGSRSFARNRILHCVQGLGCWGAGDCRLHADRDELRLHRDVTCLSRN